MKGIFNGAVIGAAMWALIIGGCIGCRSVKPTPAAVVPPYNGRIVEITETATNAVEPPSW